MTERVLIRIRRATTADDMLLAELGERTFREAFGAANSPQNMAKYVSASFSPSIQAAELQAPGNSFLVAVIGGEPVGYARLRAGPSPSSVPGLRPLEIVRFYSIKAWIGRGVGAALMQSCLDLAAQAGHDTLWLDVWEHNPRAIAFYRKWQFEVVGNQPFLLGDELQNDLLMARPVERVAL
jgi:ribosomal protein S18 acetylase RimI-like enzyme